MPYLQIHPEILTPQDRAALVGLCPFGAIQDKDGQLDITAACKMCSICVKKGPPGAVTLEEDAPAPGVDKAQWQGIAVFAEQQGGHVHNVARELLGKARLLSQSIGQPVIAVLLGHNIQAEAASLIASGADRVYCYDHPGLEHFLMEPYANALADFVEKVKPGTLLVGATNLGRSLAPRVAARFRTGLTADCTMLEMKENSDIVQIRPAFGGNIMAQIVTAAHRPQLCTVRYKVFEAPQPDPTRQGEVIPMTLDEAQLHSGTRLLSLEEKPAVEDLSEAQVIVAVGRAFKTQEELEPARELARLLGAQLACTRPLVECGWFDAKRQIGLSGRTVGAKLIVTLGISGAVQFAAGMRGCGCIIAVNKDEAAPIFDVAHHGFVGDVHEMMPALLRCCKEVLS